MEDHPIMFVVMAVYGLIMLAWYTVQVAWILLCLIAKGIEILYRKITKTERIEVNNNGVVR